MNNRRLTVFSGETENFYTTEASFLVRVALPEREQPALYSVDNIHCLESWERIDGPVDWSGSNLRVLGTFPTLQAMRDEHTKGVELIESTAEAITEELGRQTETDDESLYRKYRETLEENRPLVQAAQGAVLRDVMLYGVQQLGIDSDTMMQLGSFGASLIDSAELYDQDTLAQLERNREGALWMLFDAEDDAENLRTLIDWFKQCTQPPYTVLHNPTVTNYGNEDMCHIPRTKVSVPLIRQALGELVVMFEDFGTMHLDGEELIDEAILQQARAIVEGQEADAPIEQS